LQVNGKTIVKTYTGYANAPKVTAADDANIYAVATDVGSYYVANVVVVELTDYKGSGEAIFVYNYPEDIDTLKTATIQYIDSNGALGSVTVSVNDLKNAGSIDYGPAYLYGTAETGYTIDPMDPSDYSTNGFKVGNVTASLGLVDADYAVVTTLYDDGKTTGASKSVRDTETSSYYSFAIAKVTDRDSKAYNKGTLTDADAEDVLVKDVTYTAANGVKTTDTNKVFVSYDARGNVIYAITFDQNYVDGATTTATTVWNGLREKTPGTYSASSYKVTVDGVTITTVEAGEDYIVPAVSTVSSTAQGTGYKYGSEYVTGGDKIEKVAADIALQTGYVCIKVVDNTVTPATETKYPIAYDNATVYLVADLKIAATGKGTYAMNTFTNAGQSYETHNFKAISGGYINAGGVDHTVTVGGYYQVTMPASGTVTANAAVYSAAGVEIAKDTEFTNSAKVYATNGVQFSKIDSGSSEATTYIVNGADVSIS
jgi:hypothetical protein